MAQWMQTYGNGDPALEGYFYSIDTDRSGTIDAFELQRALSACGERSDPEFVGMLLRMYGKAQGGTLSYQDFCNVVGFMRHNNEAFARSGGRPLDLAAVEREVAETHRGFPGLGAMMPMVGTLFNSMGGAQGGGVSANNFMLIQTFMSVIRNFMSSGGGGGASGGTAGLLGGLGGLGGLGAMLGGGMMGGGGLGGFGGSAPTSTSSTSGGYGTPAGYGSAAPTQSYNSSAPSGGYGSAPTSSGAGGYGAPAGGYGTSSTTPAQSTSGGSHAGNMNSILDQIMGANLGSGPAAGGTSSYGSSAPQSSYGGGQSAYASSGQSAYASGGSTTQSYGGGQQAYGGQSSYGQPAQSSGAGAGSTALNNFQAPTGYGAPASNNNAGPAFQGVD